MASYNELFDKLNKEEVYYDDYFPVVSSKVRKVSLIITITIGCILLLIKGTEIKNISSFIIVSELLTQLAKRVVFKVFTPKKLTKLMKEDEESFNILIDSLKNEKASRAKNMCIERYILGTVRIEEAMKRLNIDNSIVKYIPTEERPELIEFKHDKLSTRYSYEIVGDSTVLKFECESKSVDDEIISDIADVVAILINDSNHIKLTENLIDMIEEDYKDEYRCEVPVKQFNYVKMIDESIDYNCDEEIKYNLSITFR